MITEIFKYTEKKSSHCWTYHQPIQF